MENVQAVRVHATKICRGTRDITPLILKLGIRWKWVNNFTSRMLYSQDRTAVPTEQKAGWTTEPVGTVSEKRKALVRTVPVFEPRPVARSQSLNDCTIPEPVSSVIWKYAWRGWGRCKKPVTKTDLRAEIWNRGLSNTKTNIVKSNIVVVLFHSLQPDSQLSKIKPLLYTSFRIHRSLSSQNSTS